MRSTFSSMLPSAVRHQVALADGAVERRRAAAAAEAVALAGQRGERELAVLQGVRQVEHRHVHLFAAPHVAAPAEDARLATARRCAWLAIQKPAIGKYFGCTSTYSCRLSTARDTTMRERSSSISAIAAFFVSNSDDASLRMFFDAFGLSSSTWIIRFASYTGLATSAYSTAITVTSMVMAPISQRLS